MLKGLDHIQIAIPAQGEDQARRFWITVLGLSEQSKPSALAGRGGLWLAGDGLNIHLGVEDPFYPARKAHPALIVEDLDQFKAHLDYHNIAWTPDADLPGIYRVFTMDPFGNRIEFLQRV